MRIVFLTHSYKYLELFSVLIPTLFQMSETPSQQQLPQQGYSQQQPFFPPSWGSWPQGWGFVQPTPPMPQSTPAATPRAVVGDPPKKKRALELEDEEEITPVSAPTRGRERGRGAWGGHLWGWVRLGYYASKPPLPSCHACKKQDCANCYEWEELPKK